MKLRYRLLLAVASTITALVLGIYLVSNSVMLDSFLKLEQQSGDQDVQRVAQAIDQMKEELHLRTVDWANWDESYRFMKDRNEKYIRENTVDSLGASMELDIMMYLDNQTNIYLAKPFVRVKGATAPDPKVFRDALVKGDLFKILNKNGVCGFVFPGGVPTLVSIRPIHATGGAGKARGWLVFARTFDKARTERLREITRLQVDCFSSLGAAMPLESRQAFQTVSWEQPRLVVPLNSEVVAGYTIVPDLTGQPGLYVQTLSPRVIYHQGVSSFTYLSRMIIAAGLVFGLVILTVLERCALARLTSLARQVEHIEGDTYGVSVALPGKDELSLLASKIDETLGRLAAKTCVLENAVEGISQLNEFGRFVAVNASFAKMLGSTPEELIGEHWWVMIPEPRRPVMESALLTALDKGRAGIEMEAVHKDGHHFFVELTLIRAERDSAGTHLFMKDVSDRKRLERDIEFRAFHDSLTGLPNRALFMNRTAFALTKMSRSGGGVAALFLDLDNFKFVNDSLGHAAGDQLLQIVAERLEASVRPGDTVARLGGDEFTVLLEEIQSGDEAVEIAYRILEALRQPFVLNGLETAAYGSIGVAFTEDSGLDSEILLGNADCAMYRAKSNGKSSVVLHDESMHNDALERMELEVSLRKALDRKQISVAYQPLVDLRTGRCTGAEALARWNHPTKGMVPPEVFIEIAEASGLIIPIGYWVMEQACRQMKAWHDTFADDELCMSVNVSGIQLQRPDVVEQIAGVLTRSGLPATRLKLEITESVLMGDREEIVAKLYRLKDLGVKLALDDFGTGFSSLSTLSEFPIDTLKIDRSFINRLEDEEEARAIVEAIMALSRSMQMDVTSEGVETPYQMRAIRGLGCQTGQGFLFAVPLSAREFGDWLAKGEEIHLPAVLPETELAA